MIFIGGSIPLFSSFLPLANIPVFIYSARRPQPWARGDRIQRSCELEMIFTNLVANYPWRTRRQEPGVALRSEVGDQLDGAL